MEIIRERTSRRTYSGRPLEEDIKYRVLSIINNLYHKTPFSDYAGKARFDLISIPEFSPNDKKKLGTYGLIKGAQDFIVGTVEKSQYNREHYGYLMEVIILAATDIGLGTCWLGGFFNKSLFSTKVKCTPNETVPAISPIGTPSERSFKEKAIRSFVKAKKRHSWDKLFFSGNLNVPLYQNSSGEFSVLLEMVRFGPSAGNKQPWRIIKDLRKNIFHFYAKKTDSIYNKFHGLDMGIAVSHFDLSAQELGIEGKWVFENPQISGTEKLSYVISWVGL
jgi:nitroreductase